MQERIDGAVLGRVVAIQMPFGVFQQRVVLRMKRHERDGRFLEAGARRACAILCPGIDEKATGFVASRREHPIPALSWVSSCADTRKDRESRTPDIWARA